MNEFLLLCRQPDYDYSKVSKEKIQVLSNRWLAWIKGIINQGKFVNNGQRLSLEGKVLRPGGVITDGPFMEIKEKLGSFIIVRAEDMEDAVTLAHGCPALELGGSVEIRPVYH